MVIPINIWCPCFITTWCEGYYTNAMKANQGVIMLYKDTGVNASNKKITGEVFCQGT